MTTYTVTINNIFMHDHGKIILFPNPEIAANFVQNFFNYSINKMMSEGGHFSIPEVMTVQNNVHIEEWTDIRNLKGCQTINFEDVKK